MGILETAANRRGRDYKYLKGGVIDIGCGWSDISMLYDGFTEFRPWDMMDGDAQFMENCQNYDCVHSSHCLEHIVDPYAALQRWIDIANKYLVIVIPDEELYERFNWPSKYNPDHKHSFTLDGKGKLPKSINVFNMLYRMDSISIIKVERLVEGWLPDAGDQTSLGVECAIEIILEKK
jgi:hypothetical protein